MNEEKCSQTVYPNELWGSFHGHQCMRKIWKDGFCKTHHPDSVEKRSKESDARWKHKMENSPLTVAYKRIKELEDEISALRRELDRGASRIKYET